MVSSLDGFDSTTSSADVARKSCVTLLVSSVVHTLHCFLQTSCHVFLKFNIDIIPLT